MSIIIKNKSLLIPDTGPKHDPSKPHLFIVLTNESTEGTVLLVPMCSLTKFSDKSCVLGKGDHPFIIRDSFIDYSKAQIQDTSTLVKKIQTKHILDQGLFSDQIMVFIYKGLFESNRTEPKILNYYNENSKI